jgi:hypothetical protein
MKLIIFTYSLEFLFSLSLEGRGQGEGEIFPICPVKHCFTRVIVTVGSVVIS